MELPVGITDGNVLIALIVAVPAVLSPIIMSILNNRHRRQEKLEDWRRQDIVALRAEAVATEAKLVATKVEQSAISIISANREIALQSAANGAKLDIVHTLVNSSLSAAKQSELNALVALLAFMMKDLDGNKAEIEATVQQISKLRAEIAEMVEAAAIVNKQIINQAAQIIQKAIVVDSTSKEVESNEQFIHDARLSMAEQAVAEAHDKVQKAVAGTDEADITHKSVPQADELKVVAGKLVTIVDKKPSKE